MECSDFDSTKKPDICSGRISPSLRGLDVDSKAMEQLMRFLIEKKVVLTSTLPVFEPSTNREAIPGGGADALAPELRDAVEKRYQEHLNHDANAVILFKKEMAWEKKFALLGGTLMAGVDPTFWAVVFQCRERGIEFWLGLSDYVAAHLFAGRSQAGSCHREPLCVDRARIRAGRNAFRRLVV